MRLSCRKNFSQTIQTVFTILPGVELRGTPKSLYEVELAVEFGIEEKFLRRTKEITGSMG
jgi:hypothetical protein